MKREFVRYTDNYLMAVAETLSHEGGYSNHSADPGGATMLGITKATWAKWTGRKTKDVPDSEMRRLTIEDALPIYHAWYWQAVGGDQLPGGVDFVVFDIAVNSGPRRALKMLQKASNKLGRIYIQVDGVVGPKTISAANAVNVFDLINELGNTRLWFYFDLSTFKTFGRGWMTRLISVTSFGTAMALGKAQAVIMARTSRPDGHQRAA